MTGSPAADSAAAAAISDPAETPVLDCAARDATALRPT
jgi:hypothetical protein